MNEDHLSIEDMGPLSFDELRSLRLYWRAANYLSLGQIFLKTNPLLGRPLQSGDLKESSQTQWGTIPGINLVYTHLNRIIKRDGLNVILVVGPGHGCAAQLANAYLEGTYTRRFPEVRQDLTGLEEFFRRFSTAQISRTAANIPGSIQSGFELGHSISHAYGAVLDNPGLIACCIVSDGEAETGALSAGWLAHLYLDPKRDGAVLPVVHLNGYKTAAPSLLSRLSNEELITHFTGFGYRPYIVEGSDPECVHQLMASAMDSAFRDFQEIRAETTDRPVPPIIILKTPKGWTGPKIIDGTAFEGTSIDLTIRQFSPIHDEEHFRLLQQWLRSYSVRTLFDKHGKLLEEPARCIPDEARQLSNKPQVNGGELRRELVLPEPRDYKEPETSSVGLTAITAVSEFVSVLFSKNSEHFRLFSADGVNSGLFMAPIFEAAQRAVTEMEDVDSPPGRIMEILSQQTCQAWLEGYILTGRHGIFLCSEHFSNLVVSMLCNFAQWLAGARAVAWRRPISSLNYLLVSQLWSGAGLQPGFIDAAIKQKDAVVTVWLPADCNSAVACLASCLRSTNSINVLIVDTQVEQQLLDYEAAEKHCAAGISIWDWAGSSADDQPDVVMACAGGVATRETLEAAKLLNGLLTELKIRVVNLVNLNKLRDYDGHPDGLSKAEFEQIFPTNVAVTFAYHGYTGDIKTLLDDRCRLDWSVFGYQAIDCSSEDSFAQALANQVDRYHLALDVVKRARTFNGAEAVQTELLRLLDDEKSKLVGL